MSSNARAPTTDSLEGENLQVLDGNTIKGTNSPPISVERAWIVQYIDLGEIDNLNRVLAYKEVNLRMEEILYQLTTCESGRNPDIFVVDTNGEISKGLYQFQEKTFYHFGDGSWKDPSDQTKVAIKMIMQGVGHTFGGWYNCWKNMNLPII